MLISFLATLYCKKSSIRMIYNKKLKIKKKKPKSKAKHYIQTYNKRTQKARNEFSLFLKQQQQQHG